MNYYPHHIGDYITATAHLTMLEDGAYRRLLDLYYSTERALPVDRKALYRLARARTQEEQDAVDIVIEEFFIEAEDGWFHSRCEEEISAARDKSDDAQDKRENERERQRRHRERRKELFNALRKYGVVPAWDTKTSDLETLLSQQQTEPVTRDITVAVTEPVTEPVTPSTRTATAIHKPIPIPIPIKDKTPLSTCVDSVGAAEHDKPDKQRDQVEEIFDYWREVMSSPRSVLDAKRKKAIERALKDGYSVDDLKRAILGCSMTPHNMGQNDRGQKYNGIELIFRSADQIDRFITNASGAATSDDAGGVTPLAQLRERFPGQPVVQLESGRFRVGSRLFKADGSPEVVL